MECAYRLCKNFFNTPPKFCKNCIQTKYCSDACRESDWHSGHYHKCRPNIFSLRDFFISQSQKSLGKGAYGEVKLVTHISTKIQYALKIIKKKDLHQSSTLKMLQREIAVQKKIIHKNVIRLYGHIEDSGNLYLILEYANKGNLFHYIRKKRLLSEEEAWYYFVQVCTGVNYLHEKNIVHRDLKPENILLNSQGLAKICDFGWCAEGTTERSTFCGTLDYMAPEILKGYSYSSKVDVWALGVLLYEMTHGFPPFNAKNDVEKSRLIRQGNFQFSSSISAECRNLIKIILQEKEEARPTVLEILSDDWVCKYMSQSSLKINPGSFEPGNCLEHPDLGQGIVVNQKGLVCDVSFTDGTKSVIMTEYLTDNEVIRKDSEMVSNVKSNLEEKPRLLYKDVKRSSVEDYKQRLSSNAEIKDSSSFSSSSGSNEEISVKQSVIEERARELERLQRKLEGTQSYHIKKKSEKGFLVKLGKVFGLDIR